MRYARALFAPALLVSGCTSFSGAPDPVISVAQAQKMISNYEVDKVIQTIEASHDDGERTSYRNRVVASYLTAADAKYDQFRRDISRSAKGGNVAFDLATLGLTGLAATWKSAASDLATGANVVAGARASINRELYFEKTLPTLLSLMDSSRLTVRSDILKGLSNPESVYTMQDAFSDIYRYQSAASIDGAIQQAAAAAADEADKAKLDYSKAIEMCSVTEDVDTGRRKVMLALEREAADAKSATDGAVAATLRGRIRAATAAAGLPETPLAATAEATDAQLDTISDYLLKVCSPETLAAFTSKVQAAGVTIK